MNILINCSNLKAGGGLQVADSVCCQLSRFPQHHFVVVLSAGLNGTKDRISGQGNAEVFSYDIRNSLKTLLWGRDSFLDSLVAQKHIDVVLTVFGPSRWLPRVKHLCGFARAQLLLKDSPYYSSISRKVRLVYKVWTWAFKRCSKNFYTENLYISDMLPSLLGDVKVYTFTNYYNQVFDQPERWESINIPSFKGTTLLTISSYNPHKNFPIMAEICQYLQKNHPEFSFRFVVTLDREQCFFITPDIESHFVTLGRVDVSACPPLYQQADIMFMPTLMECFTATYPEAMRMEVPIVTTDLEFARGLCGDAACYYSALDAEAAAEAIYVIATNKEYAKHLIEAGKKQLLKYDNYKQRANKLIKILEIIANEK